MNAYSPQRGREGLLLDLALQHQTFLKVTTENRETRDRNGSFHLENHTACSSHFNPVPCLTTPSSGFSFLHSQLKQSLN